MPDLEIESGGPVWDLVAEFLERREQGESLNVDEFIRGHPDVGERLRECLASFQWMDAAAETARTETEEELPRTFGNYELLRVIGRGGMGCVYEAVHGPLCRHVAVKVLPPHLTHVREFRLRFLREARVVASLHHTHIAPVFEVGQIGNTLYLAMPFIHGANLRQIVWPDTAARGDRATHPIKTPRQFTAAYFHWVADVGVQCADALAHAHGRGVIHRDIKPSNVLLDELGGVWVVDFGLAKAPTHPSVTNPGELIGTLRYASPEQIRGEPFDERTDVYSLGVTLYELLTWREAFPNGTMSEVLAAEPIRPRLVSPRIPRDLETIITQAMAKRPADRYATAAALGDDLRRFIRDEPIRARPIGPLGRLVRWCRRNPGVSTVAAAAALLLAALAWFDHSRLVVERDNLAEAKATADQRYADWLTLAAERTIESGEPDRTQSALAMLREASSIRFRPEHWALAIRAIDQNTAAPGPGLNPAPKGLRAVSVGPRGSEIVVADAAGRLYFWPKPDGKTWSAAGFGEPIRTIVCSPDGETLAAVSKRHVWIARRDRESRTLDDTRAARYEPCAVAFSRDGQQLALWGRTIALLDMRDRQIAWERPASVDSDDADGPYAAAAWNETGTRLAAVLRTEPWIELWSMPDGRLLDTIHIEDIEVPAAADAPLIGHVAFSPDNLQIACGCVDGTVRTYNLPSAAREPNPPVAAPGPVERVLRGHERPLIWTAFAAGGSWLLSADDRELRLWDLDRSQPAGVLVRSDVAIRSCSMDARAAVWATTDADGRLRTWRLPDPRLHRVIAPLPNRITAVDVSPDGRFIAWADGTGRVTVRDRMRDATVNELASGLVEVQLRFSPTSQSLALAGDGAGPVRLCSLTGGEPTLLGDSTGAATAVSFIGSGDRLATAHADGTLIVWNLVTRSPLATVRAGPVVSLAASGNGSWLAAGGSDGAVQLWELASMTRTEVAPRLKSAVRCVVFSPDDRLLVSAGDDGRVCGWRVPDLARQYTIEGPGEAVSGLAFCLGGNTLATCGRDDRITLWSGNPPQPIGALEARFAKRFQTLAATPDGRTLVAGGGPRQSNGEPSGDIESWNVEAIHRAVVESGLADWIDFGH